MFGSSSMSTMTVCSGSWCAHAGIHDGRCGTTPDARRVATYHQRGDATTTCWGSTRRAARGRDPHAYLGPGPSGAPRLPHRRRRRATRAEAEQRDAARSTRRGRCWATSAPRRVRRPGRSRITGAEVRGSRPAGTPSPDFVPYDDDDTDYAALLDEAGPGQRRHHPAGGAAGAGRAVRHLASSPSRRPWSPASARSRGGHHQPGAVGRRPSPDPGAGRDAEPRERAGLSAISGGRCQVQALRSRPMAKTSMFVKLTAQARQARRPARRASNKMLGR